MEYLRTHQLNLMLIMGGICATIAFFVYITKSLSNKRKAVLMCMEISAMLLLFFDRYAYIYRGNASVEGYVMVRVSNFLVFFLTLAVIQTFNMYIMDLFVNEMGFKKIPGRLKFTGILAVLGEIMVIISSFTGLYYTFDETNTYQRGSWFIVCYLVPISMLIIIMSVIIQYYKMINKGIRLSLLMFTLLPTLASLAQIFMYGLSLTNITMSFTVILIYIFALMDLNDRVEKANKLEIEYLTEAQDSMKRLFHQTTTAFVTAIDAKDLFTRGHSQRVADYAKKIAQLDGKDEQECEKVYYAALLHDVGKIGIPDSIIQNDGSLTKEQTEQVKQKPLIGNRILSGIVEYPYLCDGARSCCERYDGTGYPDKLAGDNIPEIARIIAVADAYDNMTSQKSYRDPIPKPEVREELMKCSGTQFDPEFVNIMIRLMDMNEEARAIDNGVITSGSIAKELHCETYRSSILPGIRVMPEVTVIEFAAESDGDQAGKFSAPSIVVFDSFDGNEHDNYKSIKMYHYLEYGEIWFDGNYILTNARDMRVETLEEAAGEDREKNVYKIETGRYRDHMFIKMSGQGKTVNTVIALPDSSKGAYIGITGEHCIISGVKTEQTGSILQEDDIPRIADEISYIDHMTGSVPNIQVEGNRSVISEGFAIKDGMELNFHAMTLPAANLVWQCPYIVLYSSDDGRTDGSNYTEYAVVKLNGEVEGGAEYASNDIRVEKSPDFAGWDKWKDQCREGFGCVVTFTKRGNRIDMNTENMGVSIQNSTVVNDRKKKIFVALTGDNCALTDIWVAYGD